MWSATSIPGRPTLLVLDASRNQAGWESGFCDRLAATLARRGTPLASPTPVRVGTPDELDSHRTVLDAANCLALITHAGPGPSSADLLAFWKWLGAHLTGPKLFAGCSWQHHDPAVSAAVLVSPPDFAPLAVAPQSPVTEREGGLFLLKFFTELDLHSEERVTAKMVWFSWSKARELVKRRRLDGTFGVRA